MTRDSERATCLEMNPMSLRLPDHWVWDFWFAEDVDDVHVFFLNAPRSLGDPDLRHRHARIGHAVSRDLLTWELLPQPLGTGDPGAFDDLATWTGSVLGHDGRWHLFYTGLSTRDDGAVQRIGMATSDDLLHWRKQDLVLEADGRWYEKLGPGVGEEAWRDPWACFDHESGRCHLLITARANEGPPDGRGVLAHARSDDLRSWEVGPPVSAPGEFAQLEVPQLVYFGGAWRVLFCAHPEDHSAARLSRPGTVAEGGTHYLTSEAKFGPYALDRDRFFAGDPGHRYYAGRLLHHDGQWLFFAWRQFDEHGRFAGELSDPMPVSVAADGSPSVTLPRS